MNQPTVPLWFAAVIAGGIAACGFVVGVTDPAVTWLSPNVKVLIGALNAMLGAFAIVLNIRKSA